MGYDVQQDVIFILDAGDQLWRVPLRKARFQEPLQQVNRGPKRSKKWSVERMERWAGWFVEASLGWSLGIFEALS